MNNMVLDFEILREFNMVSTTVRLLLAVILSGMVGLERSRSGRAAGLRTHILVCLGATIAALTGLYVNEISGGAVDVTRIAAQVISGIGFLGAGTILIQNKSIIVGLTTAACVWSVGAIGLAIGFGFYEAAILGALLIVFITNTLSAVDKRVRHHTKVVSVYAEITDSQKFNLVLSNLKEMGLDYDVIQAVKTKTNNPDGIGVELILHLDGSKETNKILDDINRLENIDFAIQVSHC